jgi:hypothetical protein
MAFYKKKPVRIEAREVTPLSIVEVAGWCGGVRCGLALPRAQQCISIDTLEGAMTAQIGDFVIKDVNGEFYPCKPDIFAKMYEED